MYFTALACSFLLMAADNDFETFLSIRDFDSALESTEDSDSVIGWEFYEGLYPVWYADSARIEVLEEFLDNWGDRSDLWHSRAWQYRLSSVLETADSSSWKDYLNEWLESSPEDPQAFLRISPVLSLSMCRVIRPHN